MSAKTAWPPIYPAPPVTRTLSFFVILFFPYPRKPVGQRRFINVQEQKKGGPKTAF
jgi:hypothetical protein